MHMSPVCLCNIYTLHKKSFSDRYLTVTKIQVYLRLSSNFSQLCSFQDTNSSNCLSTQHIVELISSVVSTDFICVADSMSIFRIRWIKYVYGYKEMDSPNVGKLYSHTDSAYTISFVEKKQHPWALHIHKCQ